MAIVQSSNKTIKFSITLDYKNGVPFYRQIIQQIEYAVSLGKLKPGDKLPTVRALAIELKVNPNTVAKSYSELEIRKLVNTQVGSGTFISEKKVEISEIELKKKIEELCVSFLHQLHELGVDKENAIKILKNYKDE